MKKSPIVAVFAVFTFLASFVSSNAAADEGFQELQASSEVPVDDDRIAALWAAFPAPQQDRWLVARECTVGYLGDNFWVTALHCVDDNLQMDGYIERYDGQRAGIANIYTLGPKYDVALIKVGDGVEDRGSFDLPSSRLEEGSAATLTGYAADHDYASSAKVEIVAHRDSVTTSKGEVYLDLLQSRAVEYSRSCPGDSGGPLYMRNTIYAVHTGGDSNLRCTHGQGSGMVHTDLFLRKDWLEATLNQNQGLTPEEKEKADRGRSAAPDHKPSPDDPTDPSEDQGSPSGSALQPSSLLLSS